MVRLALAFLLGGPSGFEGVGGTEPSAHGFGTGRRQTFSCFWVAQPFDCAQGRLFHRCDQVPRMMSGFSR